MYSSFREFVTDLTGKSFFVGAEPLLEQYLTESILFRVVSKSTDHKELMLHLDTVLSIEILLLFDLMFCFLKFLSLT